MWPPISSFRISSACCAASSGVSANLTPPAFIRPPVSTWDLITVGPPIFSAAVARLVGGLREAVLGDRDPGPLDDPAALVLVEAHGGGGTLQARRWNAEGHLHRRPLTPRVRFRWQAAVQSNWEETLMTPRRLTLSVIAAAVLALAVPAVASATVVVSPGS